MKTLLASPIELSRRLKRLHSWQEYLLTKHFRAEDVSRIRSELETYALLLSRFEKATNDIDKTETEQRILTLDRVLTNTFNDARLLTSPLQNRA